MEPIPIIELLPEPTQDRIRKYDLNEPVLEGKWRSKRESNGE
jgi:hypothetical protein